MISLCLLLFLTLGPKRRPGESQSRVYRHRSTSISILVPGSGKRLFFGKKVECRTYSYARRDVRVRARLGGDAAFCYAGRCRFFRLSGWSKSQNFGSDDGTLLLFSLLCGRTIFKRWQILKEKRMSVIIGARHLCCLSFGKSSSQRLKGMDPNKGAEYVNLSGSGAKVAAFAKRGSSAASSYPPQAGAARRSIRSSLTSDWSSSEMSYPKCLLLRASCDKQNTLGKMART